ncbi:hypothetical protein D3C87_1904330 [compost metagenome]
MGDSQIGLAGAGGADAEDQLRPVKSPHIGILCRCAGCDRLLAGGNLRHGQLCLALHGRQAQLVVGRHRHADRAFDIGYFHRSAALQLGIEEVQRPPCLIGGDEIA